MNVRGHRSIFRVVLLALCIGSTACSARIDDENASVQQANTAKSITDDIPGNLQGGSSDVSIPTQLGDGTIRIHWGAPNASEGTIGGIKIEIDAGLFWKTLCENGKLSLTSDGLTFECDWKFPASQYVKGKITMKGEWVFPWDKNSNGYIVVRPTDEKGNVFPPVVVTVIKRKDKMIVKVNKATLDDKGNLQSIGDKVVELTVENGAPVGLQLPGPDVALPATALASDARGADSPPLEPAAAAATEVTTTNSNDAGE